MARKLFIFVFVVVFLCIDLAFADGVIGTSSTGNINITVIIPAQAKIEKTENNIHIKTNYSEDYKVIKKVIKESKVAKDCDNQHSCKIPSNPKQTVYIVEPK